MRRGMRRRGMRRRRKRSARRLDPLALISANVAASQALCRCPPLPFRATLSPIMDSRRARGRGLLALGGALAVDGPWAKVSIGVGGLIVLGGVAAVLSIAHGDHPERLSSVPLFGSSALAWGAGTLLAFASSAHAFRRDRQRGIRALVAARAGSDGEYLWARVSGLAR